ncbi:SRPBCC family protein [Kocuria sp. M1R5S2]|uniref:SRPBCC family protein n=1 Tax=Kocuria rhizosphaerae TaxID=3376285 RepID=UPI0037A48168
MTGSPTFRLVDTVVVAADPRLVERFLLDPGCFARWHGIRDENFHVSTSALQIGTSIESVVRLGPLRFGYVNIVSEHVPGRRLGIRTTRGLADLDACISWEPAEGGTRIEKVVDGRFTEAKAWLWPLLAPAVRHRARKVLEDLKVLVETGDYVFTVPSQLTPHPPRCPHEHPPDII